LIPASRGLTLCKWDEQGMIPAIAQDVVSGRVVMFAWMNRAIIAGDG
jgi:phosphoribosyl-AMP cyclohydrolase